jgi:hypothetical protein
MKKTDALLIGSASLAAIAVAFFVISPEPGSPVPPVEPPMPSLQQASASKFTPEAAVANPLLRERRRSEPAASPDTPPHPTLATRQQVPPAGVGPVTASPSGNPGQTQHGTAGALPSHGSFVLQPRNGPRYAVNGIPFHASELVAPNGQVFELDAGVPLPAALLALDPDVRMTEQQEVQKRKIAEEFLQRVNQSDDLSEVWKTETERANRQFQLLFGRETYLRQLLNAEREARGLARFEKPVRK